MGSVIPPSMKVIIGMTTSHFLSICDYPVWSTISQGYSLQNVVLNLEVLHAGGRVYNVLKSTLLGELKECERSFQRKETMNRRPKRLAKEKRT